MGAFSTWWVPLVLLFCVSCGQAPTRSPDGATQQRWAAIVESLSRGQVDKIELFQLPSSVSSRSAITPEELERSAYYVITIKNVGHIKLHESLTEAARSVALEDGVQPPDLRWGIVFYDESGSRVGALYFDKFGRSGALDHTAVQVSGHLLGWVKDCFGGRLRGFW
jgi:hypothetical protein